MFRKKDDAPTMPASGPSGSDKSLPERRVDPSTPEGFVSQSSAASGAAQGQALPGRHVEPAKQKRLIVGSGIRMSGEITACDRLVVEGYVEARLNETRALEIAQGGHFKGGCEVEEAEITGVYEGDMTVRGRLMIRATGKVDGNIQYGEIEIERGGQLSGSVGKLSSGAGRLSESAGKHVPSESVVRTFDKAAGAKH